MANKHTTMITLGLNVNILMLPRQMIKKKKWLITNNDYVKNKLTWKLIQFSQYYQIWNNKPKK